ncbi:MAG: alpha/beta hydrolase [Chloroflexota bacterium]
MKRLGARSILKIAIAVILALTALTLLVGYAEVDNILRPPRNIPQGKTLRKFNIPYQDVELVTEDGIHLAAWYTPPKKGAVILVAHGFGDQRPEWVYEILARKGYGVLAWDARAHGESGGEISTVGYLEILDVKAALDYALAQPEVKHVGGWGGSMGAATLIRAAAEYPEIEALFVDSSFASMENEFDYLVPYPILNPLAKFLAEIRTGISLEDVSPVNVIARISPRPVYIVHSSADKVAPPDAGQVLYEAAHEPKFLWLEDGVPHQQIFLSNSQRYKKRLIGFFDEWLLGY